MLESIQDLIDLTGPSQNILLNVSADEAQKRVAAGDVEGVRDIDGQFAIVARDGKTVRMARSIGRLLRYFIAKQAAGPLLIVAERIADIRDWLARHDMLDQFHPYYTRMVPAHHLTEIQLVGCPDPNPVYKRFFDPQPDQLPNDTSVIGQRYVAALAQAIERWLDQVPSDEPLGVCFSGGIDSGAVLMTLHHVMQRRGDNLGRLKAFTLDVGGKGTDARQAQAFLDALGLSMFLEIIEVDPQAVSLDGAIDVVEDYKPLDVQCAAVLLALCRGIRKRYPEWTHLIDGDGGDENLKDYAIDINPELTIRSVLNNQMLYQEGWGVHSIKHSLTFSGGQSRGYARTAGPLHATGFKGFSPFTVPSVIEVAESIPFRKLTGFDPQQLYELKGTIVSRGIQAVTGQALPVFPKCRFQHGAGRVARMDEDLVQQERRFRDLFEKHFVPGC